LTGSLGLGNPAENLGRHNNDSNSGPGREDCAALEEGAVRGGAAGDEDGGAGPAERREGEDLMSHPIFRRKPSATYMYVRI
jgi:hypothetical protein